MPLARRGEGFVHERCMAPGRASVAVALLSCVLAIAASALAEGAWVLWVKADSPGRSTVWTIMDATDTRKACDAALQAALEPAIALSRKNPEDVFGLTVKVIDSSVYMSPKEATWIVVYHYYCLPDTVEPRGPKGK